MAVENVRLVTYLQGLAGLHCGSLLGLGAHIDGSARGRDAVNDARSGVANVVGLETH